MSATEKKRATHEPVAIHLQAQHDGSDDRGQVQVAAEIADRTDQAKSRHAGTRKSIPITSDELNLGLGR